VEEAKALLRSREGLHLLDDEPFQLNRHVGIAGVKGFMGGFGRWTLTAFGEAATKEFVGTTIEEAQTLEFALRRLGTPIRVVLLHYSPTVDTVMGEPETIHAFLGNDRLAEPIDRFGASVGLPRARAPRHLSRQDGGRGAGVQRVALAGAPGGCGGDVLRLRGAHPRGRDTGDDGARPRG
jgi:hypothetical protein